MDYFKFKESLTEAVKTPAYIEGQRAAKAGIKYSENPHTDDKKKLEWSKGHNDARISKMVKEDVELEEARVIYHTHTIMHYKRKGTTNESVDLEEKLKVSDGIGAWISDFQKSDAPQFSGKSDKDRRDMAVAAYMAAKKGPVKESMDVSGDAAEMTADEKETARMSNVSDYILSRRRQMRRTETTGGNNNEY